MELTVLNPYSLDFPDPESALSDPDGLLAVGGDLSPQRLVNAYRQGIFPWYGPEEPVLWWSPDPRMILSPEELVISRSLGKSIRNRGYQIATDTAFRSVMHACSEPRPEQGQFSSWIGEDMMDAYTNLHHSGFAHSVEVWHEEKLVGGLYGIAMGKVFFGESMFSRARDASKVGFAALCQSLAVWGYQLIDCQVQTSHLASMGADTIPREDFLRRLGILIPDDAPGYWAEIRHPET